MKDIISCINESSDVHVNMFCILKPSFLKHKNEFIKMLEDNGWAIQQYRTKNITLSEACELYKMHEGKDFYDDLTKYMSSSKSFIVAVYKECKNPVHEMDLLKKRFRKEFGIDDMRNGMHSSDSKSNIQREYNIFFK